MSEDKKAGEGENRANPAPESGRTGEYDEFGRAVRDVGSTRRGRSSVASVHVSNTLDQIVSCGNN